MTAGKPKEAAQMESTIEAKAIVLAESKSAVRLEFTAEQKKIILQCHHLMKAGGFK